VQIREIALSTSSPLAIIGAGGHAKVVIELLRASGSFQIAGLIDRDAAGSPILGLSILGTDADLPRLRREGIRHAFVGIGDNLRRVQVGRHVRQIGFEMVNAISPAAVVSDSAKLGCGIAVMAGAVINAEARIDDFCVINTCASIDHDCWIAEGAHVAVGCSIAGSVKIGRLAFVGARGAFPRRSGASASKQVELSSQIQSAVFRLERYPGPQPNRRRKALRQAIHHYAAAGLASCTTTA
jgi:UDP-perosamine 4-acetyltransferase